MDRGLPNTESQDRSVRKNNPPASPKLAARLVFRYKAHRPGAPEAGGWVAKHEEICGVSLVLRLQALSKGEP